MLWLGGSLVAAAGLLSLAGPALAVERTVEVGNNFTFTPKEITIDQGDVVTWRWVGPDTFHTVTSSPAEQAESFDSHPNAPPGPPPTGEFSHSFNTPGSYTYLCNPHSSFMTGTVVVKAGTAAPTDPGGSTPEKAPGVSGQGQSQSGGSCASVRKFRIRVRQPRGVDLASARVSVNRKPVKVSKRVIDGKLRHTAEIDLRGLSRGTYRVDIVAVTNQGKRLRGTRAYRTCADKQTPSSLPPL